MATVQRNRFDTEALGRAGALVAVCTLVLTANFVGLVAIVSGQVADISVRLPAYVLAMAAAFVGTILLLEAQSYDGPTIITLAGATALGTFVAVTLGGEGLVYAVRNPQQVVASQFLLYFLAAGLIGTGLGYWGIKHWQELVDDVGPGSGLGR